ncbi:hypothetical protein OIU83_03110 [Flavobacterium sp. LS1R49]|uniref:Uncharacterized protein n=1 Tax=Flavobacterium shii TaxID=2987687 RepID=A0A9X2Z9L3_9FLAO|nr:hypothetical protein [Flavobacterium shii]MCV9926619.1 hypothetical protein [Flavobacterium shii]
MVKTVVEINIILNTNSLILINNKNKARFYYDLITQRMSFDDSNENKIQNYSATISINFEVFNLTHVGQTINRNDGSMIAYLRDKDIQELAEKTFYEDEQMHIYDFMNLKFTIKL